MTSFYIEIEINAPRQQVWQALYHKERWRDWNTFLFDGDASQPFQAGKGVLLSLRRLPQEEKTEFQATVILVQPEICLSWVSAIAGFRNQYVFELQEIGVSRTKYIHQDTFSGILSRAFLPFIRADEQQGIKRMARELKRYVE